MIEMGY